MTDQPQRDPDRLLDEALQLPPDARQAFLDTHCGDDPQSRLMIEELLRESDEVDPILKEGGVFEVGFIVIGAIGEGGRTREARCRQRCWVVGCCSRLVEERRSRMAGIARQWTR